MLEVLRILEGEVNLREDTRVAEQARTALEPDDYQAEAETLADTQSELRDRTREVVRLIRELPDADAEFAYEIALLGEVAEVMRDATDILNRPDTGRPAIAAETDAIELLLQSRRINPFGGGGGGRSPGGGGSGDTQDSALALLGRGVNQREVREDLSTSQATGESGSTLPAEFRAGLDEYFNQLERESE